jgi:hypothetical protein
VRLLVGLVLRKESLGGGLDLLAGLLLLWLLGSVSGGAGRGGGTVTLGARVAAMFHYGVFVIPTLEWDQYIHVQLCEELGSGARIWGRELFGEVK